MAEFSLRKFKEGDQGSLRRNINDPEIARNTLLIPHPYTVVDALTWIADNLRLDRQERPNAVRFVIDIGGEVAGSVGFDNIDWNHQNAEIGYWLARKHWRQGIMSVAVTDAVTYGFETLNLHRIYAHVFQNNVGSERVLERNKFTLEGRLKDALVKNGTYRDVLLYGLVNGN